MENLETFENLLIGQVISVYNYVRTHKYKEDKEIINLLTYNLSLIELDCFDEMTSSPNSHFDLMSLIVGGSLSLGDDKFNFLNFVEKEDKGTKIESLYLICVAVFIAIEFKEVKNFFKAIRHAEDNAKYIIEDVKLMLKEKDEFFYECDNEVFLLFSKKVKEFYSIILESGVLVK